MSNFSNVYQCYLQGYIGDINGVGVDATATERQMQALALGVYHRTTSKPPLMSSVAVTAELRAMSAAGRQTKLVDCRVVKVDDKNPITVIKAIREVSFLGLAEAKYFYDRVRGGAPETLLVQKPREVMDAAAKLLREAGCVVEVS